MAEAFLNHQCPDHFIAESAGLEPGVLNPLVVRAMREIGIDISLKKTQGVFELFKAGRIFGHVIWVCDEASGERCPVFPGYAKRHYWTFNDPSILEGSEEEKMVEIRVIRDAIRKKIGEWCDAMCGVPN